MIIDGKAISMYLERLNCVNWADLVVRQIVDPTYTPSCLVSLVVVEKIGEVISHYIILSHYIMTWYEALLPLSDYVEVLSVTISLLALLDN